MFVRTHKQVPMTFSLENGENAKIV